MRFQKFLVTTAFALLPLSGSATLLLDHIDLVLEISVLVLASAAAIQHLAPVQRLLALDALAQSVHGPSIA